MFHVWNCILFVEGLFLWMLVLEIKSYFYSTFNGSEFIHYHCLNTTEPLALSLCTMHMWHSVYKGYLIETIREIVHVLGSRTICPDIKRKEEKLNITAVEIIKILQGTGTICTQSTINFLIQIQPSVPDLQLKTRTPSLWKQRNAKCCGRSQRKISVWHGVHVIRCTE